MSDVQFEDFNDDIDWETQEIRRAATMMSCSWFQGIGICSDGCREEPRCQTEEPKDGWEGVIIEAGSDKTLKAIQ